MKLPDGDRAIVPIEKLAGYALNPASPGGRHKARVFARALGITAEGAELLRAELLTAAATGEARLGESDSHGRRYIVDFALTTEVGTASVRSVWIIDPGGGAPRLVTCYIL